MKEKMKMVGFYRELAHGVPNAPSLRDAVRGTPHTDQPYIVSYLRTGAILVATMGPSRDLLSPTQERIDPPHIMTDGVWVWPLDLAHYVEMYNVSLPEEFIERMRTFAWTPPMGTEVLFELPPRDEWEIM